MATSFLQREIDAAVAPPVYLAPDRYVMVRVYAAITGRSENSIRMKIRDGKWLSGREFIKDPDGTVLIDREGVQKWILRGN
ncbi:excisionase [Variovorax sp. GT1P44]|uniref:excisionase n=1 Tax=Variovorax sp. GT1P44 TaxID=3443742 RepID=UPI003F4794C2